MDGLAKFAAIEDIRQLKSRYFRYLDTKDWERMATVFRSDAVFDLRAGGKVEVGNDPADDANIYHGSEAIIAFLSSAMVDVVSVHHGHGHEVSIDTPLNAHGVIAMEDIIISKDSGALILKGYGHYHEDYVCEDGDWRIARSRLSRLMVELGSEVD